MPSQGRKRVDRRFTDWIQNRDLGDVTIWPHRFYLMQQCDGVVGWMEAQMKYRLCRSRCKINDLMRDILFLYDSLRD